MPLPDWKIRLLCENDDMVLPFDPACVNPASIDMRIAPQYINMETEEPFESDEILIVPGMSILASTIERVEMPNSLAGIVTLKSSMARRGLDHALAGWVDPGFTGTLTLELHSHRPIVLQAGQRVIQLAFLKMDGEPEQPYQGRYQGQTGPTEAR